MCRRGQQGRRPIALPIQITLVKSVYAESKLLRFAAYFVERCQPIVNVKHSIFQSLGHHRARRLLKLQNEMRVRCASGSVEICWETEEQHLTQKSEDRFIHGWITSFGSADRALDDFTIFIADRVTRREIASVNRKAGDGFAPGPRERLKREIAVPAASLRQPIEHAAQNIDVVRQREFHHLQFFCIQQVAKRNRVIDETMEDFCNR